MVNLQKRNWLEPLIECVVQLFVSSTGRVDVSHPCVSHTFTLNAARTMLRSMLMTNCCLEMTVRPVEMHVSFIRCADVSQPHVVSNVTSAIFDGN